MAEPADQVPDGSAPPHAGWSTRSRADTRPGSSPVLLALVIVAHGAAGLALVGQLETPPAPLPVALVEVQWLPAETAAAAPAPAALPAPTPAVAAPEPAPVAPPPAAPDPAPVEAPSAAPRPAPLLASRPKTQRPVRPAPPKVKSAAGRPVKPPAPRPQPPVQRPPREPPAPGPRTADPGPRAPAATTGTATGANARAAPPARPPAAKPAAGPASPPGFNAAYLHNPAPAYPEEARRRGEEGRVLLRVQVSPAGLPERVQVQSGSGSRTLDRVALAAVQRWRFVPARRGGVAVAGTVLVPLSFSLRR